MKSEAEEKALLSAEHKAQAIKGVVNLLAKLSIIRYWSVTISRGTAKLNGLVIKSKAYGNTDDFPT